MSAVQLSTYQRPCDSVRCTRADSIMVDALASYLRLLPKANVVHGIKGESATLSLTNAVAKHATVFLRRSLNIHFWTDTVSHV